MAWEKRHHRTYYYRQYLDRGLKAERAVRLDQTAAVIQFWGESTDLKGFERRLPDKWPFGYGNCLHL